MTEDELKYHFGVSSPDEAPAYEITTPSEIDITNNFHDGKRGDHLHLTFDAFGESLQLHLKKNTDLLAPGFLVQRFGRDGSVSHNLPTDHSCYHGDVHGSNLSSVALCMSDGMSGVIKHGSHDLIVQPLRQKVHSRMRRGVSNRHVVFKRDSHGDFCGTMGTVEKNIVMDIQRRQVSRNSPKHLELLVVADSEMYSFHGSALEQYVLTLMNIVAGLFLDSSLGTELPVHLTRLIILETSETQLDVSEDAGMTLNSFCTWQQSMNTGDDNDPQHFDDAVLLTRHDLTTDFESETGSNLLGLAAVSGCCEPFLQCNINEDTGLGTAFTITHEIGHNGASCLDDNPFEGNVINFQSDMYPGQLYNADQQCQLMYGSGASSCIQKQWCMHATCVEYGDDGPDAVDGGFSDWEEAFSECSRTCGGGVQSRRRYCDNPVPAYGGLPCQGIDVMYQMCNMQECSTPQSQFASEQCSEYDSVPIYGNLYNWESYYPAIETGDFCRHSCLASSAFYMNFGQFIDGTRCSYGNSMQNKLCLSGECVTFGCNGILDSEGIFDRCGVCDGNGTSCKVESGEYRDGQKAVYVTFVTIPAGATSITVMDTNRYCHIAAKIEGTYVFSGNGRLASSGIYNYGTTAFHLESSSTLETLTIAGPTNVDINMQVYRRFSDEQYAGVAPDVSYEYYVPLNDQNEVNTVTFSWDVALGVCSKSCGTGYKQYILRCTRDDDDTEVDFAFCDENSKPDNSQPVTCNVHNCPASWTVGDWSYCDVTCGGGTRSRVITCVIENEPQVFEVVTVDNCDGNKPTDSEGCNDNDCPPLWVTGTFSKCSTTCGLGTKTREVTCQTVDNAIVSDIQCDQSTKPLEGESCVMDTCPPPPVDCNKTMTSNYGVVISPNYPDQYPNNAHCVTMITVDTAKIIKLSFTDFNVELQTTCNHDYVKVWDPEMLSFLDITNEDETICTLHVICVYVAVNRFLGSYSGE
ncbi:A disintegrin and metalloproteinase with thrombospondin motifs 18-like [Saccoglossus kowalevskii]